MQENIFHWSVVIVFCNGENALHCNANRFTSSGTWTVECMPDVFFYICIWMSITRKSCFLFPLQNFCALVILFRVTLTELSFFTQSVKIPVSSKSFFDHPDDDSELLVFSFDLIATYCPLHAANENLLVTNTVWHTQKEPLTMIFPL